ncbi:MAG: hypothetical protein ACI8QC_002636 [Planctomycetota bacterium]|jgi:hypothetical protein
MDPALALAEFTRCLQLAYSGELGAVRAYQAHAVCLRGRPERAVVSRILKDEIRHRRQLLRMLGELQSAPDPGAERRMHRVGRTIGILCHLGGWFIPMYGAARLERDNIVEYEIAARLAWFAGHADWIDELLALGEVEWDHELWLRTEATKHWAWRWIPTWKAPAPRESIRERFSSFVKNPTPVKRRTSLLLR